MSIEQLDQKLDKMATGITGVVEKQATFETSLKSVQDENAKLNSALELKNKEIEDLKNETTEIKKDADKMKKAVRFGNSDSSYNNNDFTEEDALALKKFALDAVACKDKNHAFSLNLLDTKNNAAIAYNKVTKSIRSDVGVDGGNLLLPRTITAPRMVDWYKMTYAPMLELCNKVVCPIIGITTPIMSPSAMIEANFMPRAELTKALEAKTLQYASQDISTYEMSLFIYMSTKMYALLNQGSLSVDTLVQNFALLEKITEMKKNKFILNGSGQQEANGILTEAKKSNGRISKIKTKTVNAIDLNDLLSAITDHENFVDYYINPNFAVMIDKSTFGLLTRQEALDGHYKFNNMTFQIDGIGSNSILLRVGTYTIRVMSVDHNSGLDTFVEGGTNTDKIVAVMGDFKSGYTYLESNQNLYFDGTTLVTSYIDGYIPFYKSTHFGGDVTDNKALKVLQIK